MLGIPTSESSTRGLQAEEKALRALQYHKKKKTTFPGGRVIIEISPTIHFSMDDRQGIDINVSFRLADGSCETLPVQVQTWWSRKAEYSFRRRGICLITIWPQDDKEVTKRRVFDAISNWFLAVEREKMKVGSEVTSIS